MLFHPDGGLYSGDIVSFEVIAANPADAPLAQAPVVVRLGSADGPQIAAGGFGQAGIGERWEAVFTWAWDTSGLAGPQTLVFSLDPDDAVQSGDPIQANNTHTLTVDLRPADARPAPEPAAYWATSTSLCCTFHYFAGAAADRDMPTIAALADAEIADVQARLGVRLRSRLTFNLIGRVLGHGGFASDEVTISYLDRDYAAGDISQVFRHEAVHVLDGGLSKLKPTLLTEGLAVYIAGGHFKPEPLGPRARALLTLDRFIPLRELADGFYPSQHEIGYLESGAFVEYLVEVYGWEKFVRFYASFPQRDSQAEMLEAGLRAVYDRSLRDVETEWLTYLRALPDEPGWVADVRATVAYYDAVRRYQQAYDPSAYFMHAWLPDIKTARERGLVADYLRHPAAPENLALETMLIAAAEALRAEEFDRAERLLAAVNAVLDAHERGEADPLSASRLAGEYLSLVRAARAGGYEPQRITLAGTSATVLAIRRWPALVELEFEPFGEMWRLLAR